MIGLFLLLAIGGWIAWPYIQDMRAERRVDERILERVAHRQYLVVHAPHSPASHEQLADALREAGKLEDAIAEYEKSIALEATAGVYAGGGAGYIGGGGVEQKLRLARLELDERREPEKHGQTLRTRQQPCMQCGNLANPGERLCPTCGAPLPTDTFFDTLRDPDMRSIIVKEATEFAVILGVTGIALYLTGWLRLEVRLVVFFAAAIVLANRFLKRIGPD